MIKTNFKSIYFAVDKVLNIAIKLIRIFKNLWYELRANVVDNAENKNFGFFVFFNKNNGALEIILLTYYKWNAKLLAAIAIKITEEELWKAWYLEIKFPSFCLS